MWGFNRYRLLDISPVAHDPVVEGISDGTLVLDPRGRIVDLNPSAARILGCSLSEVVGRDFREVMSVRGKATPLEGNRGGALLRRYEERGQAHEEIRLGEGDAARTSRRGPEKPPYGTIVLRSCDDLKSRRQYPGAGVSSGGQ